MEEKPQYLTENEVSKMTGIALSTLRNSRFMGKGIPYYKIGKSVRYRLNDVTGYIEARRINTINQ